MKKILFIALTENKTIRGVERYCIETIRYLTAYKTEFEITCLIGEWQEYYIEELSEIENINFLFYKGKNSKIARHWYLISRIKKLSCQYDLVHYGNTMPYFVKNSCYTLMTIHDIAEYFVPEKYSFLQLWYRKLIVKVASHNVDKIITVSNFSKKSICERLKIASEKVIVTYNGTEHFLNNDYVGNFQKNLEIVYFGVLEDSKGILELIKSFKNSSSYSNYKLIIIGKKGNVYNQIEQYFDQEKIIYKGFVTDDTLKQTIANAALVVYPSKYEGFGLPALEGFCLNDNIISSNLTSLAEVTKDFAWQIDPDNLDEFTTVLDKALCYPKKFGSDEKMKILSNFSWKKSVKLLCSIYKELLNVK